jgi:membrane-bound serine protease (ClpP class)
MMKYRGNFIQLPDACWHGRGSRWISILCCALFGLLVFMPPPAPGQSLLPSAVLAKPLESVTHRHAAIITITGPLDRISWVSVQRRIAEARRLRSSILIFKINSRTGQLTPALQIAQLIRQAGVPTVAWIDRAAIGPAALIAAACRQVVVAPDSAWGDGQSYALTGPAAARIAHDPMAHVTSAALKSLQSDQASHPLLILAAMMDRDIKIDEVRNQQTGVTRFVPPQQRAVLMNVRAPAPGNAFVHPWVFVKRNKHSGALLTLGGREAVEMGAAAAMVETPESLPALLNITASKIPTLHLDFLEKASRFFSGFEVRFIIFVMMLVCGYLEFSHPGLLIPALIGLIALALFLGGPMLTGLANWWEVGIIFLGIIIIAFDFVHFGGLGLLAIPGFILAIIGMIASFVPMGVSVAGAARAFQTGLGVVTLGMITAGVIIAVLIKYLHITPGFRRLQLRPVLAAPTGTATSETASERIFVGAVGRTVSELRPAGKARFDAQFITVVSRGEYIAPGLPVQIVEIQENQIIVQKMTDDNEPAIQD